MYLKIYNRISIFVNYIRINKLRYLGATIGKQVRTYGRFTVMNARYLQIGNRVTLNEGVHINCRDRVFIGSDVRISTNVQIHTGKLNIEQSRREHVQEPIRIENNVWIASSCVISAGVTVGENSVIAAGSVVINNIPPNSMVAGVPAKVIARLSI